MGKDKIQGIEQAVTQSSSAVIEFMLMDIEQLNVERRENERIRKEEREERIRKEERDELIRKEEKEERDRIRKEGRKNESSS